MEALFTALPIVTFVANPFEIPTSGVAQAGDNTGGGADDDADDDKTNSGDTGNSMSDGANPVDVTSLPESGGAQTFTGGGGAAVGAKCSLTTTGATLHTKNPFQNLLYCNAGFFAATSSDFTKKRSMWLRLHLAIFCSSSLSR